MGAPTLALGEDWEYTVGWNHVLFTWVTISWETIITLMGELAAVGESFFGVAVVVVRLVCGV